MKLKNIPLSSIYKEFDIYFIEKYKNKKAKKINFEFEQYFNQIKHFNTFYFSLKKIF